MPQAGDDLFFQQYSVIIHAVGNEKQITREIFRKKEREFGVCDQFQRSLSVGAEECQVNLVDPA